MQLFERGALISSAVVGLSVAGWMFVHGFKAPTCPPVVAVPVTVVVPGPQVQPPVQAPVQAAAQSTRDEPSTPVLSPEYTDDSVVSNPGATCNAASAELTAMVRGWIAGHGGILIDMQRGIAFTHPEVDTGQDGPLPKFYGPEAKRVCGSEAIWLRSYMIDQLKWHAPLTCCDGSCSYESAGEYSPSGIIKFAKRHDAIMDDDAWVLVSWSETYGATLTQEYLEKTSAALAKVEKTMPARCSETPGVTFE